MKFTKILITMICLGILFNCGAQETKIQLDNYFYSKQFPSSIEKKIKDKGNISSIEETYGTYREYFGELKKIDNPDDRQIKILYDSLERPYQFIQSFKVFSRNLECLTSFKYNDSIIEIFTNGKTPVSSTADTYFETREIYFLNQKKNITEKNVFRNNILTSKEVWKYNNQDSLLEYKSYREDGQIWEQKTLNYDTNGNISSKQENYQRAMPGIPGIVSSQISFEPAFRETRYTYEGASGITEHIFDANKKELSKTFIPKPTFEYDDLGRIIFKILKNGNVIKKTRYTYNDYNLISEEFFFTSSDGGKTFLDNGYIHYKYDSQKKLIEKIYESTPTYLIREYFEYDIKGNLVKYEVFNDYSKERHRFEYDNHGNWVKYTTESLSNLAKPFDSQDKTVIERIITYR